MREKKEETGGERPVEEYAEVNGQGSEVRRLTDEERKAAGTLDADQEKTE